MSGTAEDSLGGWSAIETVNAVQNRQISAIEATQAAITRIEASDGVINAVVVRDFDRAMARAEQLDALKDNDERRRAPLFGLPMTVKESYGVAGLATTMGFAEHKDYIAQKDSAVVTALKEAGAVILGKTNVPTGLIDLQADNPVYGRTNNPHDNARTCGGSSGGSAAALAAQMVALEFGSDLAGSIRVPAHFCGVWGHKSSHGLVSSAGHWLPGTETADNVLSVYGPMARNGDDLALALRITARWGLKEPAPFPDRPRILLIAEHPNAELDASIANIIETLANAMSGAGATVDRQSDLLPDLQAQHRAYMKLMNIMQARGIAPSKDKETSLAQWFDLLDAQAANQRQWQALFGAYDLVIAPAYGSAAFLHNEEKNNRKRQISVNGAPSSFAVQFAWPGIASYPGLPATSVPVAKDANGLPIGLQVIAPPQQDLTAIAGAKWLNGLAKT